MTNAEAAKRKARTKKAAVTLEGAVPAMGGRNGAHVSIVVPTLNSASTLDTTLSALRGQRGVDVDILVADSGSSDGTLDICRRWSVPTIFVSPGNMYAAINAGLRMCETEWLGYINSDDWVYSDSLLRLTDRAQVAGADVVYGNCDFSDSNGRFYFSLRAARPEHLVSLFRMGIMGLNQPAALFRRSLYQQLGGFDETFKLSADGAFYLKALTMGARFTMLEGHPVASFRMHSGQLSQVHSVRMKSEVEALQALVGRPARIEDYAALMEWRLMNMPNYLVRLLRNGRAKAARSGDRVVQDRSQ